MFIRRIRWIVDYKIYSNRHNDVLMRTHGAREIGRAPIHEFTIAFGTHLERVMSVMAVPVIIWKPGFGCLVDRNLATELRLWLLIVYAFHSHKRFSTLKYP